MQTELSNRFVLNLLPGKSSAEGLALDLGAKLFENCHEYTIEMPCRIGSGHIKMIDFFNGLSLTIYSLDLADNLEIVYRNKSNCLLRFTYCLEGKVQQKLQNQQVKLVVNSYSGLIHADSREADQSMVMGPGPLRLLCIEIDREKYLEKIKCEVKFLPEQLEEIFLDVECTRQFLYHHNYLHSIHESAWQIFDNDFEGVVRRTFIESAALEIISQQILEFVNESTDEKNLIRQVEVEQLKKARDILRNRIKSGVSIRELAKLVGLNQNKLKLGFKQVFGNTVNGTLLKMRLDKARLLIAANELSLREIAEEVGYENKSFFARKFREKYGVLPRDFRKEVTGS